MMRALITGATGMIGRHLLERLLAANVSVRAFLRPESDARVLRTLPVEIERGDASDAAALRRAVAGCHLVFHTAGYLHVASAFTVDEDFEVYRIANVEFTERLLAACREVGTERFVFVSSTGVYSIDAAAPISEDAPLEPASAYGRSKLLAEELISEYQRRGLPTTIVRPCITYGRGDRYFLPAALRLARLPLLPLVDGGRGLYDLIHASDVAELMWRACQSDIAVGKVYNAASGAPVPFSEVLEHLGGLTGHRPRILSVSAHMLRHLAGPARWYLAKVAPGTEMILSSVGLRYLSRDVYYDMSQARSDLDFTPQISLPRGLTLAMANADLKSRA